MAQNSGYYPHQQQPQRQYTQVFPGASSHSQPQNIYQQLGKPQPQPHLQGLPTNQQSTALVVQPQFPQSQPQNIYQQLGKPQPQPHLQGHPTYQHLHSQPPHAPVAHNAYSATLAPGSGSSFQRLAIQATVADPPSPKHRRPLPIPTGATSKHDTMDFKLGIIPHVFSGSLAISAFSTQSSILSQPQPQPIQVTTTSSNTKSPWPPPIAHLTALAPGSSECFPRLAIQATVNSPSDPPSPKRGRPLPVPAVQATVHPKNLPHGFSSSLANSAFSTQSSISSQPQPEPNPQPIQVTTTSPDTKSPWPPPVAHSTALAPGSSERFPRLAVQPTVAPPSDPPSPKRGRPLPTSSETTDKQATVDLKKEPPHGFSSSLANSALSTTQPSISATTLNSKSDTSVLPPPKKITPIWKHTIPNYPAPAWGYAVGMVNEPHPKPKAQLPTQPAPAKAPPANDAKGKLKKKKNKTVILPPPPVPTVSSAKGTTQRQQYSPSKYRQLDRQPDPTSSSRSGVQRHTYQQQRQQAYSGHARSLSTYSETQEEDEEEDDEEETEEETDSDEEDEEYEEEEQPDPRHYPQNKRLKHIRPTAIIVRGAGVPSKSLYVNKPNGRKSRIVPRRKRDKNVTQQPRLRFGGQQNHGRQARRPSGGLICGGCNGSIMGRIISAMGSRWHPACFCCTVCNDPLEHVSSYEHEGRPYCHLDYHEVRSSLR